MRRGQGNRTTYMGQLRECLGIDNNAELREIVDHSTAAEFNKWTTSRCSARWNQWGVRTRREPARNLAQIFSPAEGSPALTTLRELFRRPSEDPHPINISGGPIAQWSQLLSTGPELKTETNRPLVERTTSAGASPPVLMVPKVRMES